LTVMSYSLRKQNIQVIMIILADDNGLSSTGPDGYLKSISSIFKCIFESLFLNNEMQLFYIILCNDKFKAIVLQVFFPHQLDQ